MSSLTNELQTAGKAFLEFATVADEFESYQHAHATRIAAIADALASGLHLAPHDRRSLRAAALMHDLGEVAMERDYIQRAGELSEEEWLDLERHPVLGEQGVQRSVLNLL